MAVRFDGSTDKLSRSATGLGAAFSVTGWFLLDVDLNNYQTFWSIDNGSSYNSLITNVDGTDLYWASSGGGPDPSFSMTVGTWYFLGCTLIVGGTDTIYYAAAGTGTLTTTTASGMATGNDAWTFAIGNSGFAEFLNGRAANVKVWAATLTAAEVDAERWSYAPQRTTNLWGWYPLDGNNTIDYSGNGRTLTSAGTPVDAHGPPLNYGAPILVTQVGASGNHYTDTGLSIPVTAAVTPVDQADFKEPGLSVPNTATFTATSQADFKEPGLSLPVAVSTTLSVNQADFKEPGLSTTVGITITAPTDRAIFHELGSSFPIVASIAPPDRLVNKELGLSISATATFTSTSQADYKELARSLPITATVTFASSGAINYNETGRSVTATASVTVTDRGHFHDDTRFRAPLLSYNFFESGTTAIDQMGNGRDAALLVGSTPTDLHSGRELLISAPGQRLAYTPDAAALPQFASVTMKITTSASPGNEQSLWSKFRTTGQSGFNLYIEGGQLSAVVRGTTIQGPAIIAFGTGNAGPNLAANTTYTAALTYDGTTVRMYLNGVETNTSTAASGPLDMTGSDTTWTIGQPPSDSSIVPLSENFTIDDVRFWDVALTPSEVAIAATLPVVAGTFGLSLPVTATVGATDIYRFGSGPLSIKPTVTVTVTDLLHTKELARAVPVTASVTANFGSSMPLPIVATVTCTDRAHYRDSILFRSPVLAYNFSESGTTAVDRSGNGNDALLFDDTTPTDLHVGGELSLATALQSLIYTPAIKPTSEASVSLTIRIPSAGPFAIGSLWSLMNSTDTSGFNLNMRSDGRAEAIVRATGVAIISPSTLLLSPGNTYKLALVYDGVAGTTRTYINGVPPGPGESFPDNGGVSTAASGFLNITGTDWRIGYHPLNDHGIFPFFVDDVRFWHVALTPTEVAAAAVAPVVPGALPAGPSISVTSTVTGSDTFGVYSVPITSTVTVVDRLRAHALALALPVTATFTGNFITPLRISVAATITATDQAHFREARDLASAFPPAVLAYNFTETGTTAVDRSINGNSAALVDNTTPIDLHVAGELMLASAQHALVYTPTVRPTNAATIVMTVREPATGSLGMGSLWSLMNNTDTSGFNLSLRNDGRPEVIIRATGIAIISPFALFPVLGATYKLAVTYDGVLGETKAYVDGVQVGTTVTTATGNLNISGTDWRIGYNPLNPGPGFNPFFVDDVRFWHVALTAAEVAAASTTPVNPVSTGGVGLTVNATATVTVTASQGLGLYSMEGYRWRNDDGSETTATWKSAQDTNTSLGFGSTIRLRTIVNATGGDPPPTKYKLYYKRTTDSTWAPVPVGSGGGGSVQAVGFNATGGYTGPNATGLGGAFTVAGWFYLDVDRNAYSTFWSIDNGSSYNQLSTDSNGTTLLWSTNGGNLLSTHSMAVGAWYYLACVFTNTATLDQFYYSIGTAAFTSQTANVGVANTACPFYIGKSGFTGEWLNGRAAQVRVWSAALTEAELTSERGSTSVVRTANLWAAYSFASGPQTADDSGNGRTLTPSGTLTTVSGPPLGSGSPNPVYIASSSNITASGQPTTVQLTPPTGKTTVDFATGRMWDDENGVDLVDI